MQGETVHYDHLKALVIDDMETVRLVLKKTLGELDIKSVDMAPNIDVAWDLILFKANMDDHFDIVFCDWNMPNGDGSKLLKRVREASDHSIKYMKFVMITGSDEKVAESMDLGANNIIHKPFDKKFIKKKLDLMFKDPK